LSANLLGSSFTNSYALARIIIDIILLILISFAVYRIKPIEDESGRNTEIVYAGYVLLVWYILNIIDLFLHEGQITTAYGYILFYFPILFSRFTADILLLFGTQILISYQLAFQLRKQIRALRLAGSFVLLVLCTIALYYIFSTLAVEVLWLQMADPAIISGVASRQNQFEVSFFIVQFLLMLAMAIGTAIVVWLWQHRGGSIPRHAYLSLGIASVLWIRSFAEVIIVIRYHFLNVSSPGNLYVSRDAIYGICTLCLLLLVKILLEDPASLNYNAVTKESLSEETRTHLLGIVEDTVVSGQQLSDFQTVIHNSRNEVLSDETLNRLDPGLRTQHEEYLDRLVKNYGNLK